MEIFGIEFLEGCFDKEKYQALMFSALNAGKRMGAEYLTYFCEEKEQEIVQELGFQYVGRYGCYMEMV